MNKIALAAIGIGIILSIVAVIIFSGLEKNNRVYGGNGGVWKIEEMEGEHFVVTIKGNYQNGMSAMSTDEAYLTTEDCDLIKNFTLENSAGQNFFEPNCVIYDDTTEDGVIHVGYICKNNITEQSRCDRGLPDDGKYTWNTQDTEIKVYDGGKLLFQFFASIGACCCGVVILLIGIVMAFAMQEDDPNAWAAVPGESISRPEPGTGWDDKESAWSEKKDYIRNDEKDGQNP